MQVTQKTSTILTKGGGAILFSNKLINCAASLHVGTVHQWYCKAQRAQHGEKALRAVMFFSLRRRSRSLGQAVFLFLY